MSGYIGSKASVTLVDGYTQAEADAEFVQDPNGAITVSGSDVDVTGTIRSDVSTTGDFNFHATSAGGGSFRIYPDDATTSNPAWQYQTNSSEDQAWVIGGVERMRIDASGRVTTPYQPIVNCGIRDHNTSGTHAGSGISALYTTGHPSVVVQGGMIVSSDRVTVPVAGKYLVSARQLNLSNGGEYLRVFLNGTGSGNGYNGDTGSTHDINTDVILSCSASDYIQINYASATANRWEDSHSNLMIYLIG